jgi:ketosteroid isomerase-like protein
VTSGNAEIVRTVCGEWNAGRTGSRWMHADIRWSVPHADGTDLRGIGAVRTWQGSFAETWGDWNHKIDEVHEVDGERVLVLWTERVAGRATGLSIEEPRAEIFTLRDGKIVAYRAFLHREDALDELGLGEA